MMFYISDDENAVIPDADGEYGVDPIEVQSPAGQRRSVRFDAGLPTVVYFFSPTCGWCERNWDNVLALSAASDPWCSSQS